MVHFRQSRESAVRKLSNNLGDLIILEETFQN